MRASNSLPSLLPQSKLFTNKNQLQTARQEIRLRIHPDHQKSTEEKKALRSFIHFSQNEEGFQSFRTINSSKTEQIMQALICMKAKSHSLAPSLKAQIVFNHQQFNKISNYCKVRRQTQRQRITARLAKLQPLPMNKQVKRTNKFKQKTKTTAGMHIQINYSIYESNRACWKPFIDFDAMPVCVGSRVYFIGGRQTSQLCYFDRSDNSWAQDQALKGLKLFGESQGTCLSDSEIIFFGGSRFFQLGISQPTNSITFIDVLKRQASSVYFSQDKIAARSFHSQCLYGEYLIISGGVNSKNQLLKDFAVYHLKKQYWCQLTISKLPEALTKGFAKHKMLPVFRNRKHYHIYDDVGATADQRPQAAIKQQGIYIFGGEDPNVVLSNKLYILKIGQPNLQVYEPVIDGRPPLPRKNFGMVRFNEYIVIHGGRNDEMNPFVLNSMHFLNLQTLNWAALQGQSPAYRHSHALLCYESQVLILGGKNQEGLCKQVFPMVCEQIVAFI